LDLKIVLIILSKGSTSYSFAAEKRAVIAVDECDKRSLASSTESEACPYQ
jgi:hypothetical protein